MLDPADPLTELRRANADLTAARRAALNVMEDAILARDALRASEENFRTLFAAAPVPFMVLAPNPPDFTITAANDAYFAATLTTPESLIGRKLFDVFTDDPSRPGILGSEKLAVSLDRVLTTRRTDAMERTRYDLVVPGGGFEPHWWDAINAPMLDPAGRVTAIIHQVHRVTELHFAEQSQRQDQARQEFLLKLSDALRPLADAVEIKATATRLLGGHLNVNRAFYAEADHDHWLVTEGYERGVEPLPDQPFLMADYGAWIVEDFRAGRSLVVRDMGTDHRFQPPERAEHEALQIAAVVAVPLVKGGALVAMLCLHTAAPRDWADSDLGLIAEAAERTWAAVERAQAQAALRHRTAQFETLVNQAPLGVYLVDADFRIREVNPVALLVFGDIPGGVAGRDFDEVIHVLWEKKYADELVQIFRHTLTTGEPYVTPERAELRADSGVAEYYEWRLHRIILPDGRFGVVCYFRDISDHVQTREEFKEIDRRRSEFLAMLAHELRNPLAPIRNAAQALRLSEAGGEAVRAASAMMERQVGHMVRLVDDLLDVSRISRGKIELRRGRVELASVLHQAVEANRSQYEDMGHELTVTVPPKPIYLNADPTRLTQMVGNLLNNACKFTDRGGRIELSVAREDGEAVLRVRDSGVGIASDQLARVFDMFTQIDTSLERSVSGLGIGLTLVKSLAEMHGGAVAVHSAGIGRGSEFEVRLPIPVDTPDPPPEPTPGEPPPTTGRRILVVDDNRDSAESLSQLLELTGNETNTAYDGLEAVAAAAAFRPGVVLLDIGLPKLNGYEVARRIREQPWGKGMTLVALTGWGQDDDRRKSKDAGFNGHLVKPVDYAALTKLLAELLSPDQESSGAARVANG